VKRVKPASGFTLIEVLVALTIFAIMSGIAYRGLGSVLDARARIVDDNRKWREVALAFAMIERDVSAAADRVARSRDDLPLPPFTGNAPELSREAAVLEFSRMGVGVTPSRRVAYRLSDGTLQLLAYPSIDAAPHDEATAYALLTGVQSMATRFLDAKGNWQTRWPVPATTNTGTAKKEPLPRAVALTITLVSGEDMTRVFALP
jgi:general secretion pathway protein J